MNTSSGLIRQCLITGLTSLVFSAGAVANIMPNLVEYPSERPAQSAGKKRPLDNPHKSLGQRTISDFSTNPFVNQSGFDSENHHFEITYAMLSGLASAEQPTDLGYGTDGSSNNPDLPGGILFRRVVLDDNDYTSYPDTALLATLFLVVGLIGYAQHLIRKNRQQPKRRPLFPA
ncbi:MAG: hypothetical protein JNL84_11245 [Candidatus Accumulibacter sp.]|nr:hypothetical protein [Accumulibacter sp.]